MLLRIRVRLASFKQQFLWPEGVAINASGGRTPCLVVVIGKVEAIVAAELVIGQCDAVLRIVLRLDTLGVS